MAYKFVEDIEVIEISDSSDDINITEDFEESFESSINKNRKKKIQEENFDLNEIQNEPLDLSLPKSSTMVKFLLFFKHFLYKLHIFITNYFWRVTP